MNWDKYKNPSRLSLADRMDRGMNPMSSLDLLEILSTDTHSSVRSVVAFNPSAPVELLVKMLENEKDELTAIRLTTELARRSE